MSTNKPLPKGENHGRNLYLITLIVTLLALAVAILMPTAEAAPARAAQRPLENEILRIAQTVQGSMQPAPISGVRDVSWAELQQEIASNRGAIVIEFYRNGNPDDPAVADDCDKCSQQLSVYEKAAQHYAGRVTFLRFDVDKHPQLMNIGLVVFPTHVFMVNSMRELWVHSVRGFLSEKQFEELMEDMFKIKP